MPLLTRDVTISGASASVVGFLFIREPKINHQIGVILVYQRVSLLGFRGAEDGRERFALAGGFVLGIAALDVLNALCCLLYTSPSPRDGLLSRMPSSA